jgi:hypothetical protein
MALSAEERLKVISLLDEIDEGEKQKALSSLEAFGNWLSNAAYWIYCKVKDAMGYLWSSICSIFS